MREIQCQSTQYFICCCFEMTGNIYKLLILFAASSLSWACSNLNDCYFGQFCVDSKCTFPCDILKCGINAECVNNGYTASCFCKLGYEGDPMTNCTKLDRDPCDPNPCGPNSICKQGVFGNEFNKKVGAFCLCEEQFYGKPPNCRTGCESNDDCGSNEICDKTKRCVNYCALSICGPNSVCRNDNHTGPRCSCIDGYIPQAKVGCRLKTSKDKEIPIKDIQKQLEAGCRDCMPCTNQCYNINEICVRGSCIKNVCSDYCYSSSNCGIYNGTLECFSTFDFTHNPFQHFVPEFSLQSFDPCNTKAITPECGVSISEAAIRGRSLMTSTKKHDF